MKISIIGANGYFGSKLVKYLEEKGHDVSIVVRSDKGVTDEDKTFVINSTGKWDDSQFVNLINHYNQHRPDVIIDLAWSGSTGEMRNNRIVQNESFNRTIGHSKVAEILSVPYFYSGTISQKAENHETAYGEFKAHTSYILNQVSNANCLLFSNICGGEDNTNRFLINVINKLKNNEPVSINSTGEQLISVIYHETASELIESLITTVYSKENFIGSNPASVKYVVETLKEIIGSTSEITFGEIVAPNLPLENNKSWYNIDDELMKIVNSSLE